MKDAEKSWAENRQELSNLRQEKEALEKELAQYKQLVNTLRQTQYSIDNVADSVFWIDEAAKIHFVNDAACKNLGYSKEELLTMTVFDFDASLPKDKWNEHWKDILEKGSLVIETIHRTKNGKEIPVEVTTNLVDYGGIQYNCAIAHNIIERKKAEERLKKVETIHKKMVANLGDVIMILDKNGITQYKSPNVEKLFGWKPEELEGKANWENIYPDDIKVVEKYTKFLMENPNEVHNVEMRYKRKDGSYTWINFTGVNLFDDKDINGILGNYHDISERKSIEESLKESEARFKALHNASFGGIMIHDKGVILDCNKGLSEMTGYSLDELIGKEGFKFVTEGSKEIIMKKIQTADEKPYEAVGVRKNGEEFPISLKARNIPYKGKTVRAVEIRDITQSKQAEEEVRKMGAVHNKMVANLGDVIVIIDKDGINKYKSPNIEKVFGWKPEDLVGKSTWDNIHPEDLKPAKEFINSLMVNPQEVGTAQMRYKRKNGSYSWIEFTGVNLLYDEDINGILGNYHDIGERKKIEQSLIESETRFKALHNASFGGITIHDKGIILECNNGLSDITGYSIDELIGMNGLKLIAESSRDFVMDKILSGYEKPYEAVGLRKNGEEYPIRLEARNVPYKGKMVRTVEFRDITEQKKSEQALRESEQKFKDLANFLPQTIFETDNKMNVTFINREATNAFGYTEEDIKNGLNAIEVIIPEDRDRLRENFLKVFHTKSNSSNEYTGIKKDGSTFPIIVSSSLIIKEDIPIGVRGIILDITQRKQAEEELQKQNKLLEAQYEKYMKLNEVLRNTNYDLEIAKKEAEDSNKAKSIFLANMSHELRTPLFGILGYSDLLMKFVEDEDLKEMATGVNRTGKRLLDTISLILDLSKIEADNYKTNISEHDSILILSEVFNNLKGGALAKNLEYSFLPHTDKFKINTDPEMFRIIFENILGNAIKFTVYGSVKISTFEESIGDKKTLNIIVTDTGIGIDEDDIPLIFTEFKQLSEGTTKNFPGSGLGLSITRKFVELLNGKIAVKSKKDVGTSVEVKFKTHN